MQWDLYAEYLATGIPGGEYISSAFIILACALGLIYARKVYSKL